MGLQASRCGLAKSSGKAAKAATVPIREVYFDERRIVMGSSERLNEAVCKGTRLMSKVVFIVFLLILTAGTVWISSYKTITAWQRPEKAPPSMEEYQRILKTRQAELKALTEQAKESTRAVAVILIRDARLALIQKNYTKAMNLAQDVIQLDPGNAEAYKVRGMTYYLTGQINEAVADLSESISLAPRNPEAFLYRGLAKTKQSKQGEAVEDFTQAVNLNSNYGAAYYYRAVAWQQLGQAELAKADFQKACDLGVKQACAKAD